MQRSEMEVQLPHLLCRRRQFPGPHQSVMETTPGTRPRSSTPSLGRRFRGAGSAASFSLASSPWRTPGVRSRSAPGPAPIRRADTSWSWPMGGGIRPAGPSAPPGVLMLIYNISWKIVGLEADVMAFAARPAACSAECWDPTLAEMETPTRPIEWIAPQNPRRPLASDSGPHLLAASGEPTPRGRRPRGPSPSPSGAQSPPPGRRPRPASSRPTRT